MKDIVGKILKLLKKEELYAKFSKWEFCDSQSTFSSGHVIDCQGIHVDPAKIESIKDWASPKTPTEIRQFLGLAGYYRRFIEGFSKIAKTYDQNYQKAEAVQCTNPAYGRKRRFFSPPYCDASMRFGRCVDAKRKEGFKYEATSLEEREPLRVRALVMTIGLDLPKQILNAQTEARKLENIKKEDVGGGGYLVMAITDCNHARVHKSNTQYIGRSLGTSLDMSTAYHPELTEVERTIQTLEEYATCVRNRLRKWFGLNICQSSFHIITYHASIKLQPFEAFYVGNVVSPVCWAEFGQVQSLVQISARNNGENHSSQAKDAAARDRPKSLLPNLSVSNGVQVGDKVMLKSFRWGTPSGENLPFCEEPVEIMIVKSKTIETKPCPIVKVRWNSRRGRSLRGTVKFSSGEISTPLHLVPHFDKCHVISLADKAH
ncbi:putative reverse transcriptase domain-containing protein [Tanacetum coccineum]